MCERGCGHYLRYGSIESSYLEIRIRWRWTITLHCNKPGRGKLLLTL